MRHLCRHIWCPGMFKCSVQGQNSRWKDFVLWFFAGGHTLLYLLARDGILRMWIPQNYDYQNQRADSPFFGCHFLFSHAHLHSYSSSSRSSYIYFLCFSSPASFPRCLLSAHPALLAGHTTFLCFCSTQRGSLKGIVVMRIKLSSIPLFYVHLLHSRLLSF